MAARALRVYLDGTPVGTVEQTSGGTLGFSYDSDYRARRDPTPLSLSMPLTGDRHRNKAVRAFLDGLLPDSEATRQRWARDFAVSSNNPFALLRHVGLDAAGAVQVLPADQDPTDATTRTGDVEWLTEDDFIALVGDLAAHADDWDPGRFGGRWSLAGAQPKIALFHDRATDRWGIPRDSTPTTAIVKPAIAGHAHHHVNEALCQRAATEAGLLAADVDLVEVGDVHAVISHRYDRRLAPGGRWVRVHQEDLCQALSVHPSQKYQSDGGPGVGEVADLLGRLPSRDRQPSAERFFKGLAFNTLIGGTDSHAKNYSLVLIGSRAQMAPLYDLASAAPYPQHSRLVSPVKVGKHTKMLDITTDDFARAGRRLGVGEDQAVAWVEELRATLPDALHRAAASLPAEVAAEATRMAERIGEHVAGTWRPDLDRDPARIRSGTSTPTSPGQRRAKTTAASNRTSFAPHERDEPDLRLEP